MFRSPQFKKNKDCFLNRSEEFIGINLKSFLKISQIGAYAIGITLTKSVNFIENNAGPVLTSLGLGLATITYNSDDLISNFNHLGLDLLSSLMAGGGIYLHRKKNQEPKVISDFKTSMISGGASFLTLNLINRPVPTIVATTTVYILKRFF